MAALMQTLIIPIQPILPQLLDTSASSASWVLTATLLGGAVAMPIAGRLGDMFGKRRVLVGTCTLLVTGSVMCALSDSLIPVVAGRAIQGMAMGFIPVAIALMREVTPPRLTSQAVAAMSATLGIGGAIGLPLSAWIADFWDWHGLFWVSGGAAAVVLTLTLLVVPAAPESVGGRLDLIGALGLAVGLCGTLIAVSKGNDWGWAAPTTLLCGLGGAAVLALWSIHQLGHRQPLVDLRVSARPAVLFTNAAAICVGFGIMAQSVVMPALLQMPQETGIGMGQSILAAGLWMAPGGLMMLVCAPLSGMLINRMGPKYTLVIGGCVLGCGYLTALFLMNAPWQLMIAGGLSAAGVGIGYAAMPALIMGAVPLSEAGSAVGLNGLMRSVGTTVASSVMVLVLTFSTMDFAGRIFPTDTAFRWCFFIGACAAFVGVAFSLLIPGARDSPAAAARHRKVQPAHWISR